MEGIRKRISSRFFWVCLRKRLAVGVLEDYEFYHQIAKGILDKDLPGNPFPYTTSGASKIQKFRRVVQTSPSGRRSWGEVPGILFFLCALSLCARRKRQVRRADAAFVLSR